MIGGSTILILILGHKNLIYQETLVIIHFIFQLMISHMLDLVMEAQQVLVVIHQQVFIFLMTFIDIILLQVVGHN